MAVLHRPYATIAGKDFLLFDVGFAVGTVGLVLILAQAVVRHTRALYQLEPNAK